MVRRTRRKQRQQKLRKTRRQVGGGDSLFDDFIAAFKQKREELDAEYRNQEAVTSYPLLKLADPKVVELMKKIEINTLADPVDSRVMRPYKLTDLAANQRAALQQYSEGMPIENTGAIDKLLLKDEVLKENVKRIEEYLWSHSGVREDPTGGKAPTLMHYVLANLPLSEEPERPILSEAA